MATDVGSDEISDTAAGEHNQLRQLGKYRIEKRIGAGGMGTVFLAVDTDLNRTVALKVLPKDRAGNPVLVRRFKAEGQAAAQMEHPNIVRVFEAGEADGFLYMALEYVEGIDVYELVERRGVIPVKRSTDIIRQTTLALQHAYDKGIVHRDIKPSNLLIKRDGSVKLADMGLARSVDETLETNITRAGTTVGTVDYMSPEQARNSKAADVRSDIYSLGCTWFHMLTGHPPFPDGGMTNKLQAHAVSPRPDPRSENDQIPEGIVAIIQRMMACKPDDRYQAPQELLDDLEAAGRMHRTVDETTLAALANEVEDPDDAEDDSEAILRVGDVDDLDLAALKDSAEYELSTSPPKPIKSRWKSKRKSQQNSPDRGSKGTPKRPTGSDQPDSSERPAAPTTRVQFPVKEDHPANQQAARRTPPPAEPPQPTEKQRKPARKDAGKKSARVASKRGAVTRTDGGAPDLPTADPSQPVDGSTKAGFDLETLKFMIPAALIVAALIGIGYALVRGSNALGISSAINPYAGENTAPDQSPIVGVEGPVPAITPDPDPTVDTAPPDEADEERPPQVAEVPFPGAEDVPAAAPNEQPLIPGWVEAFRRHHGEAERSLVVRRRPDGSGQVASINDAVDQLPRGGGTIEIDGDGPFRLEPLRLKNRQRIRLHAARGRRPVVQLVPDEKDGNGPLVAIEQTQVEFEGLHFVLVDATHPGGEVFRVQQGNVAFKDCSITIDARQPAPLTVLRVNGSPPRAGEALSGKCLLENVVIRGPRLTCVALDGPASELVAGNCLFASEDAPVIVINDTGPSPTGDQAERRAVRLLATTILSTQPALLLVHEASAERVAATDVVMRHSLLVRPATDGPVDGNGALVLTGWPQGTGGLGGERVQDLSIRADQSCFMGWPLLLTMSNAVGELLEEVPASTDAWRKFWNQGLRSDSIIAESIPPADVSSITPENLNADLAAIVRSTPGTQQPGCRPDEFPELPAGLIAHVAAAMRQPFEPDSLGRGMTIDGDPVRFDLGLRRSLARYIAGDACKDGTHIIAFGNGLKELDPIVIEGKSIRLEFESGDKSPLLIQPVAGRDGAPPDEAFITVRNGALDLIAAPLKLPTSRRRTFPRSLIVLDDASLAVRSSTLEGPRLDVDLNAALIRTTDTQAAGNPRHILLEDSFLVSLGPLVAGPARWELLIGRNCVFVSQADALTVHVESTGQRPASVVLDHCTIATGGAAVHATTDSSAVTEAPLLTLHGLGCIFPGPVTAGGETSVVVTHSPGAARNGAVVWWGRLNGFSDRLDGSVIDGAGPPGDFASDWPADWGEGHEANSLTGKADVLFLKPLPDLRGVEPMSFQLSDSATAATWGRDGKPIGASVETIGPAAHGSEKADLPKGNSPGKAGPRLQRNNPGF